MLLTKITQNFLESSERVKGKTREYTQAYFELIKDILQVRFNGNRTPDYHRKKFNECVRKPRE